MIVESPGSGSIRSICDGVYGFMKNSKESSMYDFADACQGDGPHATDKVLETINFETMVGLMKRECLYGELTDTERRLFNVIVASSSLDKGNGCDHETGLEVDASASPNARVVYRLCSEIVRRNAETMRAENELMSPCDDRARRCRRQDEVIEYMCKKLASDVVSTFKEKECEGQDRDRDQKQDQKQSERPPSPEPKSETCVKTGVVSESTSILTYSEPGEAQEPEPEKQVDGNGDSLGKAKAKTKNNISISISDIVEARARILYEEGVEGRREGKDDEDGGVERLYSNMDLGIDCVGQDGVASSKLAEYVLFKKTLFMFYRRYASHRLKKGGVNISNIAEKYYHKQDVLNARLFSIYGANLLTMHSKKRPRVDLLDKIKAWGLP